MRKKILAATVGGASALALGAGLFAWSATVVTIEGVESAGAADMTEGCLGDGALVISQNDPIYVSSANGGAGQWFVTGINVAGDAGSDASMCVGQTLKVSYVNDTNPAALVTAQVGSVANLPADVQLDEDVAVNHAAEGGFGVPLDEVLNWQVVISDVPVI